MGEKREGERGVRKRGSVLSFERECFWSEFNILS
jgi:hypothetical protein